MIGGNGQFGCDDGRWSAVIRRDAGADGVFWYAVRTTGVYCRPSCAARLPLRENVGFFASGIAAERAGFRPCRRCRPDLAPKIERDVGLVAAACRRIEASDTMPSLSTLAQDAGMGMSTFHRLFRTISGVTPVAYGRAHRATLLRAALERRLPITRAMMEAGFNSSGRFYENSAATLGMTPKRYRDGGEGAAISVAVAECSLGFILVAATAKGVVAIQFGDAAAALIATLRARFPSAVLNEGDAAFAAMVKAIVGHVEVPSQPLDLPLDIRGTAFQQRVWQALRAIGCGETSDYTGIARAIERPSAVRAVAGACAANPIAVIIPCHRVLRADGALSGYRWGVERKRALLDREAAASQAKKSQPPRP